MRLNLTIQHKIWLALAGSLSALLAIATVAELGYARLESSLVEVVEDVQPLAMEALDLRYELESGSDALSLYLLTKETRYREEYLDNLERVGARLDTLRSNPRIQAEQTSRELLAEISAEFARYRAYHERMLPLATDLSLNFPGVAVASNEMSPIGEELRTLAAQMAAYPEPERLPVELLLQLQELRYLWANVMLQWRGFLGYRDQASAANLDVYMQQVPSLLATIRARDDLPLEIEVGLDRFAARFGEFIEPLQRARQLHEGERWRTDAYLLATEVAPLHEGMDRQLRHLTELLRARIAQTSAASLELASTGGTVIAVLGGLALLLGIAIAWVISRVFRLRVGSAVTAMVEVAEGDGNLSRRLDDSGSDEMSRLAAAFNKFVAKIKGVVDMVTQCSTGLSVEAEAMSRITEKTRQGVERQRQEIGEVAQAVTEMTSMVGDVAEHADSAARSAREAATRSASGRGTVDSVTGEIEGLAAEVNRAADVIRELERESKSIGEVVDLIREIAEQTNLLALNAAIEAARAGDQGRGFAVVADEVRNLANRTYQGTEDIRHRIERLQERTGQAAAAMASGNQLAGHSVEQARAARDALDAINEAVARITDMNERIAEATTRQTAVSDDIAARTRVIQEIADATVEDARKTSSGSHELNLLAAQMEGLVTDFLLKGPDRKPKDAATRQGGDGPQTDAGPAGEGDVELF